MSHCYLQLLFLSWTSLTCSLNALKKFPNIDYLGMSYNIIKANTQNLGSSSDPGFTEHQIITFTDYGSKTSDGRYQIPNNTQITYTGDGINNCSLYNAVSRTVQGDTSYTVSLSVDTKLNQNDYNFYDWNFTASKTYSTFNKTIYGSSYNDTNVIVSVTGLCNAYYAKFRQKYLPQSFVNAVKALPPEFSKTDPNDHYYQFIMKYGQYYASHIDFGSKCTQSLVFTADKWSSMIYQNWDITNRSITHYEMTIGVTIPDQAQATAAKQYATYSYNTLESQQGANPNKANGHDEHWLNATKDDPFPIQYHLDAITDLFSTRYIPSMNAKALNQRKNNLLHALQNYCKYAINCNSHLNDVTYTNPQPVYGSFNTNEYSYHIEPCSQPNMVPISCGLSLSPNSLSNQNQWAIYPYSTNGTSVYDSCRGYFRGNGTIETICVDQTSATLYGYEIKTGKITNVQKGIDVYCPNAYWRTGCGIESSFGDCPLNTSVYPVHPNGYGLGDEGTGGGCHCDNGVGTWCYAICFGYDGLQGTHLHHNTSGSCENGCEDYISYCNKTNYQVLGCGMKTVVANDHVRFVSKKNNHDQCSGYGENTTLWSICGSFTAHIS